MGMTESSYRILKGKLPGGRCLTVVGTEGGAGQTERDRQIQSLPRRLLLQPERDFGEDIPGGGIARGFTAVDHPHHFRDDTVE
jgi:hypothetical protein